MTKETITFRVDQVKREALDAIAKSLDRDRTYVLNEAIASYLEMYSWQIAEIEKAVLEADAEDFASHQEVEAIFDRLTDAAS